MIGEFFIGIARLLFWFVILSLIIRFLRSLIAPFTKRRPDPNPPPQPPEKPSVDYGDVKDASFTDLK